MIKKELISDSGHTKLNLEVDGDKVLFRLRHVQTDSASTVWETFSVEDFIEFGKSLTLNERGDFADQIKSDAITDAKLLAGDFNSL